MNQATYRHHPSFTRHNLRSVIKMRGLPRKPRVEPAEAQSIDLPAWMKNKKPKARIGVPFAQLGVDYEDRDLTLAMTAPRSVSPYWRQLRDERFSRGNWADHRPGTRYVLVSGYQVGANKPM